MNYVLIGDIHSQNNKLQNALEFIKINIKDYYIIFLGDVFDSRCEESNSVEVYKTIKELQSSNKATLIHSNHQWKLQRYLYGNNVKIDNSLQKTINDFNNSDVSLNDLLLWLESLPYACAFRDELKQEYRCAHAYHSSKLLIPSNYEGLHCTYVVSNSMRDKLIYGCRYEGNRVLWWQKDSKNSWIRCAGHYHTVIVSHPKRSIVLDSCCGNINGLLSVYNVNTRELFQF